MENTEPTPATNDRIAKPSVLDAMSHGRRGLVYGFAAGVLASILTVAFLGKHGEHHDNYHGKDHRARIEHAMGEMRRDGAPGKRHPHGDLHREMRDRMYGGRAQHGEDQPSGPDQGGMGLPGAGETRGQDYPRDAERDPSNPLP